MQENLDQHRFICVYTRQQGPLTARDHRSTSTGINCALGQRSKIVLNIHPDWLGYFEWSRMVLQGFWQGACVVTDPSFDHPLYQPGIHYLEENPRHMGELVRWLLETPDGSRKARRSAQGRLPKRGRPRLDAGGAGPGPHGGSRVAGPIGG